MLSAAVQKATEHFIQNGEEIANENPEIRTDMLAAIDEVKATGEHLLAIFSVICVNIGEAMNRYL